ncbi:MAG TPA: cation-translocating P-type ATPase, partial [Rhodothermales bacterium]|nr:cation-translocating P-type ATPase [Rhodothermales bacterium]
YTAYPARQDAQSQRTDTERRLLIKLGICWALAGNVMLFAFTLYAGLDLTNDPTLTTAARGASFALALISVIYGGSEFFRRSWASLQLAFRTRNVRTMHMDTPISLGILVGFGHSAWATFTGRGEVWFDSITVLIAALLTARWLQVRSRRLAGDASDRLLSLLPTMARRVRLDGTTEVIRLKEVAPDDVIEVPAGEVIPVDGPIVFGTSTINNAVLTGESRPETVSMDDIVEAGATNLSRVIHVRAQAAGEDTRIGKLLAWIRSREDKQAVVVLLADRLSGYFVLGVLTLALLTAFIWLMIQPSEAAQHVVALLVISCPCALGMATPLAMAVASGRAARTGIFIKSDQATQQLAAIDTIVLDKTGTVTEGRMTLVDYEGDDYTLDLAATLEAESTHPIALALVQARSTCNLDATAGILQLESHETVIGEGLRGRVAGHEVAVGRPAWIEDRTGGMPASFQMALSSYTAAGHTPVAVSVDGRCQAVLALGDRLRPDSSVLVDRLRAEGKTLYLLSGDHPDVVQSVAQSLSIPASHAFGGVSPEDKKAFIEQLCQEHTVAMIGDGVNDAAALQAAQVGIAVQGGSTPSLVAADVFLTREGLQPVSDLLDGSRHTMRVIRRNLGLSLLYNVLGASAAMLGFVTPLVAAIAMPISSLVVVLSSILQRSFGPAPDVATKQP